MYGIGDIIDGRYKVLDICGGPGKSGMGIVYICIENGTNIPCALKTFQDRFLTDESSKRRFKREALKWIQLDKHPYIVKANFYSEYDYRPYINLEFIPKDQNGRNCLTDYISTNVPTEKILELGIQFCIGMIYAYSKGIRAHVDIKPDNIMVTPDGNVKITDFGLAKSYKEFDNPIINEISFLYSSKRGCGGTILYMAPEQFDGTCNQKSDIYSFGMVLYRLITNGNWPFFSYSHEEWENLHKKVAPNSVSHYLFPIVERCLKKDPEQRYENFNELKGDLEKFYKKLTGKTFQLPQKEELEAWELNNKGISLYRLSLIDDAKIALEESVNLNSNNPLAHNNLGLIYESKGQLGKAKIKYIEALNYAPEYSHANNNLGNILLYEGNCNEAIKYFKKAIWIDSKYYDAYFNLGNTYYRCGKPLFAVKRYFDTININPNHAGAYGGLGVALFDLKNFKCCEWAYKKALEIKPDYCRTYFNLGNLYSLKNENMLAINAYENFIKFAGSDLLNEVNAAERRILSLSLKLTL